MAGPRQYWGWHHLDPHSAARYVADAGLSPGAWVLDVGAGQGALTGPLVAAGARVIAIESHPGRAQFLRDRFGDVVTVVQADASRLRLPRHPFHVVANPPFAVITGLLRRLLQPGSRLVSARLVVPVYVARRWSAPTAPAYRRWSQRFDVTMGARVPRRAFRPPPTRDARVLVITSLRRGAAS